ncbi:MAG: cation diffusion facilitator family transporter, partial [Spirochaetota bacterium]
MNSREYNQNQTQNRASIIRRTSRMSMVGNGILALLKIFAGFLGGSLALLGDGIDSIADATFDIVSLFTAKLLLQAPNARHPWGYGRAEAIATKVLSMLMIFSSLQLLLYSSGKLIQNLAGSEGAELSLPGFITLYVSAISVPSKLFLAWYKYRMGKRIQSKLLIADARNMLNDSILSASVLLGLALTLWSGQPVLELLLSLA